MLREAINAFQRVLTKEAEKDTLLGCPSTDEGHAARRQNAMAMMTGGRGFRTPKAGPKLSKGGKTRADREAPLLAVYRRNLDAERQFREARQGQPGWGIARIRDAIEKLAGGVS
jgi:hypothetical protein